MLRFVAHGGDKQLNRSMRRHIRFHGRYKTVWKRVYRADGMVADDVLTTPYDLGSLEIARRHNRSQSYGYTHLGKLADLGALTRSGGRHCCRQRYGISAHGRLLLEKIATFFRENPAREWVLIPFVISTVRSLYKSSRFSGGRLERLRRTSAFILSSTFRCHNVGFVAVAETVFIPLEDLCLYSRAFEDDDVVWRAEEYVPSLHVF